MSELIFGNCTCVRTLSGELQKGDWHTRGCGEMNHRLIVSLILVSLSYLPCLPYVPTWVSPPPVPSLKSSATMASGPPVPFSTRLPTSHSNADWSGSLILALQICAEAGWAVLLLSFLTVPLLALEAASSICISKLISKKENLSLNFKPLCSIGKIKLK